MAVLDLKDFSGIDQLLLKKKRTVQQLAAEKAARFDRKLTTYAPVVSPAFTDADSGTFTRADGTVDTFRIGGTEGEGFDAFDSFFITDPNDPNYAQSQRKRAQQVKAYSRVFKIPEKDVTDEHLAQAKQAGLDEVIKAGFDEDDKVRMLPAEDGPKRDQFGRLLVGAYNAKNERLSDLFNNPETNAAYNAPFNTERRNQVEAAKAALLNKQIPSYQSGFDEDGNPRVVLQGNGTYTYGKLDNLNEDQIEEAKSFNAITNVGHLARKVVGGLVKGLALGVQTPSLIAGGLADTARVGYEDTKAFIDAVKSGATTEMLTEQFGSAQRWPVLAGDYLSAFRTKDAKKMAEINDIAVEELSKSKEFSEAHRPETFNQYKLGEWMNTATEPGGMLHGNPVLRDSFLLSQAPDAIGMVIPIIFTAVITGGSGAAAIGASLSASAMFNEAVDSGASLEDAYRSAFLAAGLGTTEAVPIMAILTRIDKRTGGVIRKAITKWLNDGSEEALQEFGQTVGENAIASDLVGFDPDRKITSGALEASGAGGIAGAFWSVVFSVINGRRGRGSKKSADTSAEQKALQAKIDAPVTVADTPAGVALQAELEAAEEGSAKQAAIQVRLAEIAPDDDAKAVKEGYTALLIDLQAELDKPTAEKPAAKHEPNTLPEVTPDDFDSKIAIIKKDEADGKSMEAQIKLTGVIKNYRLSDEQQDVWDALRDELTVKHEGTLADVGPLGSLQLSLDLDDSELQAQKDAAETEEEKSAIQDIIELKEKEAKLAKRPKKDGEPKTQAEVHEQVNNGITDQWTGFRTYVDRIAAVIADKKMDTVEKRDTAIAHIEDQMTTHAANIRHKLETFQAALKTTPDDGKVVTVHGNVVEGSRLMNYEIKTELTAEEAEIQHKATGGYVTVIDDGSSKLIAEIAEEADYGDQMVKVATGFAQTPFGKVANAAVAEHEQLKLNYNELQKIAPETTIAPISTEDIATISDPAKATEKADASKKQTAAPKADAATNTAASKKAPTYTPKAKKATADTVDTAADKKSAETSTEENSDEISQEEFEAQSPPSDTGEITRSIGGVTFTFLPKGDTRLDGALARITADGIVMQQGITKAQVLEYINGSLEDLPPWKNADTNSIETLSETSVQKQIVTKYMQDTHGVDLISLVKGMTDQQVREFIIQHELSHLQQNDAKDYFGPEDTPRTIATDAKTAGNPYLTDQAIKIEARANMDALEAIGLLPKAIPKVGKKIGAEAIEALKDTSATALNFVQEHAKKIKDAWPVMAASQVHKLLKVVGKTVADLLKFNDKQGIQSLPDAAFTSVTNLTAALTALGMSPAASKDLATEYTAFAARYKKLDLDDVFADGVYGIEQPVITLYPNVDGTSLNHAAPQVVFAMMIANMAMVHQNEKPHVFFNSYARERFLYGTQTGETLAKNELVQLNRVKGHPYKELANATGAHIVSMLNIKPAGKEADVYFANLTTALGLAALQVNHTPANKVNSKSEYTIDHLKWNFDTDVVPGRIYNSPRNAKGDPIEEYRQIIMHPAAVFGVARSAHIDEATKLFGKAEDYASNFPLQKPATSVVQNIPGTFGGIPQKTKDVIGVMQAVKWTPAQAIGSFTALANAELEDLHTLAGVVEIPEGTHPDVRESLEAQNADKINTIKLILDAQEAGYLSKLGFYFKYSLMNHNRLMMDGRLNPQISHITRHIMKPFKSVTYTDANIHLFKMAVVFNLGYSIDKHLSAPEATTNSTATEGTPAENILSIFDALVENPHVKAAVTALQQGNMSKLSKELLAVQREVDGGDISILSAITALAQYKAYQNSADVKSFKSDVPLEIDGITNGFAMTLMQFPMEDGSDRRTLELFGYAGTLEKRLNQTGTYFGVTRDETTHLVSGIFATGKQPDVYVDLQGNVIRAADAETAFEYDYERAPTANDQRVLDAWNAKNDALIAIFPSIVNPAARDLVKTAFMIYQYGGGIVKITKDMAKDIIVEMKVTMGDIQRMPDSTPEELQLKRKRAEQFVEHITLLGARPNKTRLADRIVKGVAIVEDLSDKPTEASAAKALKDTVNLNDEAIEKSIINHLSPRYDIALDNMLGATTQGRKAVVAAGEIMHATFIAHFDVAYAAKKLELNDNKPGGRELAPQEVTTLVRESLRWVLPQYAGPLNQANEDVFVDLSKQVIDRLASKADNVRYKYKNPDDKKGYSYASSTPTRKKFVAPGVSALIRTIINMDASLMALTLDKHPNVLSLYDAFMGSPEDLVEISKFYGEQYVKLGMETNILASMRTQMDKVLDLTGPTEMAAIKKWMAQNSFTKSRRPIDTFDDVRNGIYAAEIEVTQAKINLGERGELTSNQMNIPNTAEADPTSDVSYPARLREILHSIGQARRDVYFALDNIDKLKSTAPAAYKALKELFDTHGAYAAINLLREITPESAATLVKVAEAHKVGGSAVTRALKEIKKAFPEDKNKAVELLGSLLTGEQHIDVIEHFADNKAMQILLERTRTELAAYTHNIDFAESLFEQREQYRELRRTIKSLEGLDRANEVTTHSGDITSDNIHALFEQFKSLSRGYYNSDAAMEAHSDVLEDVIDLIATGIDSVNSIKFEKTDIDGITQGDYVDMRNKIRVFMSRQPPASANGQSGQEVYVHELVHAMTVAALRANPLVRNRIEKAYRQTKLEIDAKGGHTVFLEGIDNPSAADIEMAKAQYEYVFDNDKNETNRLAEFLAYGLTNKALVTHLQKAEPGRPVRGEGLLGRLIYALELVMDAFMRAMRKGPKANQHLEMIAVMEQLIEIQNNNESTVTRLGNRIYRTQDALDAKIIKLASEQATKLIKSDTNNKLRKLSNIAIGGAAIHLSKNAGVAAAMRKVYSAFGATIMSLAAEMGEGALTRPLIRQQLAVVNVTRKARHNYELRMLDWFDKVWKSTNGKDISVETKNALTDALLRTDLSSLLNIKMPRTKIAKLLGSSKATQSLIKSEKDKILAQLNLTEMSMAIKYAEELGLYLATGNTTRPNAHNNVHTLAKKLLSTRYLKEHPDTLELLDAYSTLAALQYTDSRVLTLAGTLSDAEFVEDPTTNGIIDILDYHANFKQASRNELFGKNPMQMTKGWIVERVDNLHAIETGTMADEPLMRKRSFTENYELGEIPGIKTPHTRLYVSRHLPEIRYVPGIFSNTGQHTKGTSLTEILMRDPKYKKADGGIDMRRVYRDVRKVAKQQELAAEAGAHTPKVKLRPVYDGKGDIADYRVIMDHVTRKKLLQPDLEFQNVFAHMQSTFIDRRNSIITDMKTVDELVHEQVTVMPYMKKRFVDILDPESPYKEQYRRLPQEVRDYMSQYTIGGKFMVREDIINKVFGFEAKDFSKLTYFQKESRARQKWLARMAHHIVTSTVQYGVDRVVIATGTVVALNLMSNVLNLMMMHIPPSFIAKKTMEGFKEYQVYQKDSDRLRALNMEIEAKGLGDNSLEAREATATLQRMESNKLHRLNIAGLHTIIAEDLNEASTRGYMDRAQRVLQSDKITKYTNNFAASTVGHLAKTAFMTQTSVPYRLSKQVVSLTDFLARYVMIEHATTVKGQDFESASFDAVDAFVLFDENMDPWLEAINSVAGTMFMSYFMRVQRTAKKLIKEKPTAVATAAGIQYATGFDALAQINSSIYAGNFMPPMFRHFDILDMITDAKGIENVNEAADLIGIGDLL